MKNKDMISVPNERIVNRIYLIRGEKAMLDSDLAELYGVPTWNVTRAVTRNIERFPEEFMFELSQDEAENLKRQIGVSSLWGGSRRSASRAFTQEGVAMLSSVLKSKQAIQINILIIKAFVQMRKILETNSVLRERLVILEQQLGTHSKQIQAVYAVLQEIIDKPVKPKGSMGFKSPKKKK